MTAIVDMLSTLFDDTVHITGRTPVAGGCINTADVITLSSGDRVFVKTSRSTIMGMFEAEAAGLEKLRCPGGPRVPDVLGIVAENGQQHLLLEYIATGKPSSGFPEQLGHQLATLHQSVRSCQFGLDMDNYIGLSPQQNTPHRCWITFFGDCRLRPQVNLARRAGHIDARLETDLEMLISRLNQFLTEPEEKPTLVHGDLWSGNIMNGPSGEPVIVDPAVYYGHRETDLAMTELFGRLPDRFYEAYREAWPLEPGYEERRDLYNLYHMLNHLNLFGSGYLGSVRSMVRRYL